MATLSRTIAVTAAVIWLVIAVTQQLASASGRAACPGAEAGPGWGENIGVIATKSTDMGGTIYAKGATRCTIRFYSQHKTAPYCLVSGPELQHVTARVLRTDRKSVTFTFDPPLTDDGFDYTCVFKD